MKAGIICFTEHGVLLAEQLVNGLAAHGILCEAWLKKKEYRSALPVEVAFSGRNPARMDGGAVPFQRPSDFYRLHGNCRAEYCPLRAEQEDRPGGDRGG